LRATNKETRAFLHGKLGFDIGCAGPFPSMENAGSKSPLPLYFVSYRTLKQSIKNK
jgi:hypothetical protein